MMIRGRRDRRRAQRLQDALERYERALDSGTQTPQARAQAAAGLDDIGRTFALAVALEDSAREITPDEAFVRRVAMQLRSAQYAVAPKPRRAPRFSLAPLALSAATVIAAVVLIPSLRALPGDPLYAVKGAAEDARVWWARGQGEALIRLDVAAEKFEEVERLVDRSRVIVSGPGVLAASAADFDDPELARLIEIALSDAGRQLEAAADILTSESEPAAAQEDIAQLLEVTQRGREITAEVAQELSTSEKPPVLRTEVKLAKIEAKAKAAQTTAATPEETPPPCATPSPSPTPSPSSSAAADGAESTPSASPTLSPPPAEDAAASPEAEQTPSPEATPCTSPSPSPSPEPTEEPEQSPEAPPSESASVQGSSADGEPDEQDTDSSEQPQSTPGSGWSPPFERA